MTLKNPTGPKPTKHTKSSKQRREDRRDAIKLAAIQVFSELGYHSAKVSQIVERVGVAQGTFYLYYQSKEQLFGELLQDFLTLVVEAVASWEPAALATRDDLRHELTRVGSLLTTVLYQHSQLAAIFFKEALTVNSEFDALVHDFYETLTAMLTTFNTILHQRGLIKEMNFHLLAIMTIGQVERIILEYIVYKRLEHIPHPELVAHLVAHFMSGTLEDVSNSFQKG
jgi:AcrR family transcriptional regulator